MAMDEETIQGIAADMIDQAVDYTSRIEDDRVRLTNAYNGDLYGDEVEGRSQIVTRDIRDTVRQVMPSTMRILTGAENPCQFVARRPDQEQNAQIATQYVRHIVESDNHGYIHCWNACEDAFVRKTGVFKVHYDDRAEDEPVSWSGVTEDELQMLMVDPDITLDADEWDWDAETGTYSVSGVRSGEGRIVIESVPPEEYITTDDTDSPITGHRRMVTRSYLRELGYTDDDLENVSFSADDSINDTGSRQARDQYADVVEDDSNDPSLQKTEYIEAYIRIDEDEDGIAELRKVCTAGPGRIVLSDEEWDESPLIAFTAWPVAHAPVGTSLAEILEDLQRINTNVTRNTLNSLAQATNPDLEAVENMVNLDDLMNPEMGKIIRVKNPGMLRELNYRFVGPDTLPFMDKLERMREQRTGITAASQGLDAKSLQSTTASAVDATQSAAMAQMELLTRNIVETGFIPLYRRVLRLIIRNQNRPRQVRVAGAWLRIDPRYWDADMYIEPSEALGAGNDAERRRTLELVLAKQEQIIQAGGIDNNPLITAENYYNTLSDMVRMGGFRNPERYFRDPSTFQPPEPQPPQPDPDLIRAEADAQKKQAEIADIQAERQYKQQQLQLELYKARLTDDRLRDSSMADLIFKMLEAQQEQGVRVDLEQMRMMLDQDSQDANRARDERLERMRQMYANQRQSMTNSQRGANGNDSE